MHTVLWHLHDSVLIFKRKPWCNRVIMAHTSCHREDSNRVQKPFHLLLENFKVSRRTHLSTRSFIQLPHWLQEILSFAYKSVQSFPFSEESLPEALWKAREMRKKSKLKKVQGQKSRFTLGTSWLGRAQAAPRKGCTSDRYALGSQWHLVAPKPLCLVYSKLLVIPFSETLLLLYIKGC